MDDINILNQGFKRKLEISKYENQKIIEILSSSVRFISQNELVEAIVLVQNYDIDKSIPILYLEIFLDLNSSNEIDKDRIMNFSYKQTNFIIKSNYNNHANRNLSLYYGSILYDKTGKYTKYKEKINEKYKNWNNDDSFFKHYTFEFEPPLDINKIKKH